MNIKEEILLNDMSKEGLKSIILIGNPNVGKSVIFSLLSGRYTTVSNYPGTTVEYDIGEIVVEGMKYKLIDTPGINSLLPMSEDEQVTRDLLLEEDIYAVIVVGDGKNLKRTLNLAMQVLEMGLTVILVLNMMDEASELGIKYDFDGLSELLRIPVIGTVAVRRKGIDKIFQELGRVKKVEFDLDYGERIEQAVEEISSHLSEENISRKAMALMLLSGDRSLYRFLQSKLSKESMERLEKICADRQRDIGESAFSLIQLKRLSKAEEIYNKIVKKEGVAERDSFIEKMTMHSIIGYIFLVVVLILVYLIVGKLGAQVGVGFMEDTLFNKYINPFFSWFFGRYVGENVVSEFFIGRYGLITMALTYGFAIILPIVVCFFMVIGILEDTGYLPRLSVLLNKLFKKMGLNGKAVIPMILGLGCDTMATMTTRILDTKKERILATFLLALAVPCSAQLSIIFAMVSKISIGAFLIWLLVISGVLVFVGYVSAHLISGESSDFILEVPPLRIPQFSNIIIKTIARLEWYLKEVIPLFILSTAILFAMDKMGLLKVIERIASPIVVNILSLPAEAAGSFLMGFLRRDYAAAGLLSLFMDGRMDTVGAIVSMVTITLFVPCFANTLMIIKERGIWIGVKMVVVVFVLSIIVGGILNFVLRMI